jgi:hypothetical protein
MCRYRFKFWDRRTRYFFITSKRMTRSKLEMRPRIISFQILLHKYSSSYWQPIHKFKEFIKGVKFTNHITDTLPAMGVEITLQDLTLIWRRVITFNLWSLYLGKWSILEAYHETCLNYINFVPAGGREGGWVGRQWSWRNLRRRISWNRYTVISFQVHKLYILR